MDFLPDFWHHLGTSQALNGSQNDAKIVHKSMPKSSQNVKPLEKAPRRPKTAPSRPQDGLRDSKSRKMEAILSVFGIQIDYKSDLMSKQPESQKTRFSLHNFNTFLPSEAMFSKPKTVENRQRNHVSTVEALFRIRRTQKARNVRPRGAGTAPMSDFAPS